MNWCVEIFPSNKYQTAEWFRVIFYTINRNRVQQQSSLSTTSIGHSIMESIIYPAIKLIFVRNDKHNNHELLNYPANGEMFNLVSRSHPFFIHKKGVMKVCDIIGITVHQSINQSLIRLYFIFPWFNHSIIFKTGTLAPAILILIYRKRLLFCFICTGTVAVNP